MKNAKRSLTALAFLIVIITLSCSASKEAPMTRSQADKAPAAAPAPENAKAGKVAVNTAVTTIPNSIQTANITRKIIKSGDIDIQVKTYNVFASNVEKEVNELNGYISQKQSNTAENSYASADITVRIPAAKLDQFLDFLKQQNCSILRENIKSDDISEQYYDLQARLDNAKKFEARLLEMINTRTGNLQEVVQVEEKLNQVREQIEQFEGKLRYLDNLSDLSTITLHVRTQETFVASKAPGFGERAGEVWQDSLNALKMFTQGVLLLIIALIPWVLPLLVFIVLLYFGIKMLTKKSANQHK